MNHFYTSIRVERRVKMQKWLEYAAKVPKRPCRCALDQYAINVARFESLAVEFEKNVHNINDDNGCNALVNKVRFKFESRKPLAEIMNALDMSAFNSKLEIDVETPQVKLCNCNYVITFNIILILTIILVYIVIVFMHSVR